MSQRFLYCAGMYLTIAAMAIALAIMAFGIIGLIRIFAAGGSL